MWWRILKSASVLVATSRPCGWFMYTACALAGLIVSSGAPTGLFIAQLALMTFPLGVVVFGLNDVYDSDSDALNTRKGHVEGVRLHPRYHALVQRAAGVSAVLLVLSAALTRNAANVVGMALLVAFAYAYSSPPLRLKERPLIDSLANGMMILGAFIVGFSYGLPLSRMYAKWYFLALAGAGVHAFSTIMDYTPDARAGYRTFAIVLGKRAAAMFALITGTVFGLWVETDSWIRFPLLGFPLIFLISFIVPSENLARTLFRIAYINFLLIAIGLAVGTLSDP